MPVAKENYFFGDMVEYDGHLFAIVSKKESSGEIWMLDENDKWMVVFGTEHTKQFGSKIGLHTPVTRQAISSFMQTGDVLYFVANNKKAKFQGPGHLLRISKYDPSAPDIPEVESDTTIQLLGNYERYNLKVKERGTIGHGEKESFVIKVPANCARFTIRLGPARTNYETTEVIKTIKIMASYNSKPTIFSSHYDLTAFDQFFQNVGNLNLSCYIDKYSSEDLKTKLKDGGVWYFRALWDRLSTEDSDTEITIVAYYETTIPDPVVLETLKNDQALIGLNGSWDNKYVERHYKIVLPDNQNTFRVSVTAEPQNYGDCKIYLRKGSFCERDKYDVKGTGAAPHYQSITVTGSSLKEGGDWYIMLRTEWSYSGFNLNVTYS